MGSFPEIDPLVKPAEPEAEAEQEPQAPESKQEAPAPDESLPWRLEPDWQVVQRHVSRVSNRPKELLVRIQLPGMTSINELNLDVQSERVTLRQELEPIVKLDIKLPFAVESENGSAKFDADKSTLEIQVPVCQPVEKAEEALLQLEDQAAAGPEEEKAAAEQEHVMAREQKMLGMGM